jgi:hypothetical protein
MRKMFGTCPITGIEKGYVPGNWYDSGISFHVEERIACDGCDPRCEESKLASGFENENGRYHGGYCYPKGDFVIFRANRED